MNQTDYTKLGGMPLELDDLEYDQKGIHSALNGLARMWGNDAVALYGLLLFPAGGGLWNITAGAVVFSGRVFTYPGGASIDLPGGPGLWGLTPVVDYDPAGNEVFEDLSVHDTYIRATLSIVGIDPLPSDFWAFDGGVRVSDRVRTMVPLAEVGEWHIVGEVGEPALEAGMQQGTGEDRIAFRREPGDIVRIRGVVDATNLGSSDIFILPLGFRPRGTQPIIHYVVRTDGGLVNDIQSSRLIRIDAISGMVKLVTTGISPVAQVYNLAQIAPWTTQP